MPTSSSVPFWPRQRPLRQQLHAYWVLCKPNVVLTMLVTVTIGMILAANTALNVSLLLATNFGIGCCAGAAAAINQWVDRRIDATMHRTQQRPLVKGQVSSVEALVFALVLSVVGQTVLWVWVNGLTAGLTFATLIGYAVIYTALLKRATPQNIVIGGLAGAMPPLLGWVAVTNSIDSGGLLLTLIVFVWTPPHFWALAIHRVDDYRSVGIPMLPVTHGIAYTKLHIVLYTVLLCAVTALPVATGLLGVVYGGSAVLLNAVFLGYALKLMWFPSPKTAIHTFIYSIVYLLLLFIAMMVDRSL